MLGTVALANAFLVAPVVEPLGPTREPVQGRALRGPVGTHSLLTQGVAGRAQPSHRKYRESRSS